MASGKRATKPSKDKARQFYDRRRAGIDRKVRSLITGESNEFGVAVNVTIIYEYRNEVSFFRSHLDETNARWFSSLNELRSASVKGSNTNMGCVDQATLELIKWQESQKSGDPASSSLMPAAHSKKELTEDILKSTHPSLLEQDRDIESSSQSDPESDDDSQEDESEFSDEEENYTPSKKPTKHSDRQLPHIAIPEALRRTPKRRRSSNNNHIATPYQTPSAMYPPYNTYPTAPGQLQVPTQHMHITGQPTSLGGYSLQNSGPSMDLVAQSQNAMELGSTDPFGAYDLSLPQEYNSPAIQPNQIHDMLPVRTRTPPEVPRARKVKRYKSAKSTDRVSNRRRITGEGEAHR